MLRSLFGHMLSVQGRTGRCAFVGVVLLTRIIAAVPLFVLTAGSSDVPTDGLAKSAPASSPLEIVRGTLLVLALINFLVFWFMGLLAAGIKRCHDMDQSGWFCLALLVPFVNFIVLVGLAVIQGTPGDNRFGPARRDWFDLARFPRVDAAKPKSSKPS